MKIGEILSRLFFWGVVVICGVGAYFNCPLVGEVESSVFRWLFCIFLAACCGVMVWYGLFPDRVEENDDEYCKELKEMNKSPLRKKIDDWVSAVFFFAYGGFMLYMGVDCLMEDNWLGFILGLALCVVMVFFGVMSLKPSPTAEDEEAARQFRMKCSEKPVDKDSLVLVRNVKSKRAVEKVLRECVPAWCEEHTVNAVQLWQVNEHEYAVTFPCGVNEEGLIGVLCGLSDVGEVRAWVKTSVLRSLNGEWSMVVMDASDELVAATDRGKHYITYVTDDGDIRWKQHYETSLSFTPSPGMSLLKVAKRLGLYF